jgi:hypothetical protein
VKPEEVATIVVRLLGLVLALLTLDSVVRVAFLLIGQVASRAAGPSPGPFSSTNLVETLVAGGGMAPFALGLYMFFSGKWFIRRVIRGLGPPPEGICPACNYDLAGLRVSRCPECGETLPKGVIRATEVAGKEQRSQKGPPRAS